MTTQSEPKISSTDIRRQAEEVLKGKITTLEKLVPVDIQSLVHELQVHQIELEMQNEELRRTQQELEDARDRYCDLYDFAPIGYFTLDKNGMILEINLTAAKKLGIERYNLTKTPFSLYLTSEYKDVFYLHLRKLINTQPQATYELQLVDKNGNQFDALLEGMPVKDSEGNIVCRTAMSDIAQRKRAEEVIQKFNEELEQRVRVRTAELEKKNAELEKKIDNLKKMQGASF